MRSALLLLLSLVALAGCGAGGSGGEEPQEGGGTRQAGSEGEQLDAEGVSELAKLVDAIEVTCGGSGGGSPGDLAAAVASTKRLASENSADSLVELNDADRAPNFQQFVSDQAQLLQQCGEAEAAQELRTVTFGPDEDTNASG